MHYEFQGKHYELPDGLSNKDALTKIRRHLIGKQGEENARKLAPAPPDNPRAGLPRKGASFGEFQAWRQDAMGDLGRSEPQTPEEVEEAGKGALTGLAATGVIAAPLAALKLAGSGATGFVAGEATEEVLKRGGVNAKVADYAGTGVSMLSGGGAGTALLKGGAKGAIRKGATKVLSWLSNLSKKEVAKVTEKIVVKSEVEALRASAILRQAGKSVQEVDDILVKDFVAPKVAETAAKTAAPAAKKAAEANVKAADDDSWRVVIQYGKHKGQRGVKIKHGMGNRPARSGGGQTPGHDTIRLDSGKEVVVPGSNVLTDLGKGNAASTQKAIDAVTKAVSPGAVRSAQHKATQAAVIKGIKEPMTKAEHELVLKLQGLIRQNSKNKAGIQATGPSIFGDNWPAIWKHITAPATRI